MAKSCGHLKSSRVDGVWRLRGCSSVVELVIKRVQMVKIFLSVFEFESIYRSLDVSVSEFGYSISDIVCVSKYSNHVYIKIEFEKYALSIFIAIDIRLFAPIDK